MSDKVFRFGLRRQLVLDAREHRIKAAARRWQCSRNTVRLWMRRYDTEGLQGLRERSHAPGHCPHKTDPLVEARVLDCRQLSGYGAKRLKMEFALSRGPDAVGRILRQHRLTRSRRTKRVKKNDLRQVKARLKAFETVQMDIKYLRDIPFYLPQMRLRDLPGFQYTPRDVKTGLLFLAFADELSKTWAVRAVERFLRHLHRHGVELCQVTIQTDNGVEFDGQSDLPKERGFLHAIAQHKARHRFIPPGCSNANADVESSRQLIETEFYDRETFAARQDFLRKAWSYQCHFNLSRKNSCQQWRTPIQRLEQSSASPSPQVVLLPPVFLDTLPSVAPARRPSLASGQILTDSPRLFPARLAPKGGQDQPEYRGGLTGVARGDRMRRKAGRVPVTVFGAGCGG